MREKLFARRGMTLTEVLAAMLVASLVALAVAAGVSSAVRVYRQSVEFAEAQVLASTLSQAVTDELHYARDIQTQGGEVTFTSAVYGEGASFGATAEGRLTVSSRADSQGSLLVGSGAYSQGLRAEVTELSYDGALFTASLVISSAEGRALKEESLLVRPANGA